MGRIKRYRTPQGDKFFDTGTSNVSFLQLAMDLKTLGVKNYFFMLEIVDISLVHVNPYAVDDKGNPERLSRHEKRTHEESHGDLVHPRSR